jgi:hypothetical protein
MKPLLILIGTVLIPAAGIAAPEGLLKAEYVRIVEERNQAPFFAEHKMEDADVKFLEAVKREWELRSSECPDTAFTKIVGLTGMSNDVKGVVDFFTHETPPFSGNDDRRNAKEAVIAATLTVSLPISVDNLVHTMEGLAYIKNSQTTVTVFEDTEKGLKRNVYVKPAEGEQAGAGQPTTRPESDSEGGDKPQPESKGRSR